MEAAAQAIEHIYCEHCHLATPTWKRKCIHCGERLRANTEKMELTGKR